MILGLAVAAVLALAVGLRFYRLDAQSLWNDEGTAVALAGRNLALITQGAAADIHPPLYYYLLHYWLRLFGAGEAAARSLSAVAGVGLVGLIYLLGRRLFDPLTGWLAALLAAVSSFQVYYAQEARMYMLLAFLGAASSYLFYLGWLAPGGRRRWWAVAGWVVVTTLAAYTHYLAAAVVVAQNVAWVAGLCLAARRPRSRDAGVLLRQAAAWAGAQAVVGALYLPWLRLTWAQLHRWPAVSQPFDLLTLLKRVLPLFALGPMVEAGSQRWLVAGVLGLALLGLARPDHDDEDSTSGRILALLLWAMPVALLYYLSRSRPVYHPKFLLPAAPGFVLLVARGISGLGPKGLARGQMLEWVRLGLTGAAVLLVLAASWPGLRNNYTDPRYARDDYRGVAHYISTVGRPGDVVLINAPSQIETVTYYYPGPLPLVPMPLKRPPDREETVGELAALAERSQRIFAIFWASNESDPEGVVEGWLDSHAHKALDAWYGSVRLAVYALPSREMGDDIRHPLHVNLGGQVRLAGYTLASEEVAAGEILQLNLFWEAINVIQRRYKVFTHVIDSAGHVVGQRDSEPCGGRRPTHTWREGEEIVDRYGLPIQPGTPPGEYVLEVGMYNPDDGLRLPLVEEGQVAGDHIILQRVRVVRPQAPPPLAALDMQRQQAIVGEDIQLLGYSFGRLGSAFEGAAAFRPGQAAELVLFWQAVRAPQRDVQVLVRIVDKGGRVRFEHSSPPVGGRHPVRDWQPEEIVRDPLHVPLPADLAPGRYRLLLGWQADSAAVHELATFVVQ